VSIYDIQSFFFIYPEISAVMTNLDKEFNDEQLKTIELLKDALKAI
jgi:hypothetical protein